jgi:hypothetical protein
MTLTQSGSPSPNSGVYQAITVTAGKLYRIEIESIANTGGGTWRCAVNSTTSYPTDSLQGVATATALGASGVNYRYFRATDATTYLHIACVTATAGAVLSVDNITVKEVAETTVDLSSGAWVRGSILNKTITNPCVAIKIATSGDAVDVAYAQMETGAFVTSPIVTGAASVTRAADTVTIATTLFPTSVTAQTIYIAAQRPFKDVSGRMLNLANGNNYFLILDNGTQVTAEIRETAAGVTGGGGLGDHGIDTPFKAALAGQANDSGAVLNGGTPVTDVTVTMPTSYTTLTIGSPTTWINGHVRQVMALPRRMSNAELVTVTT